MHQNDRASGDIFDAVTGEQLNASIYMTWHFESHPFEYRARESFKCTIVLC